MCPAPNVHPRDARLPTSLDCARQLTVSCEPNSTSATSSLGWKKILSLMNMVVCASPRMQRGVLSTASGHTSRADTSGQSSIARPNRQAPVTARTALTAFSVCETPPSSGSLSGAQQEGSPGGAQHSMTAARTTTDPAYYWQARSTSARPKILRGTDPGSSGLALSGWPITSPQSGLHLLRVGPPLSPYTFAKEGAVGRRERVETTARIRRSNPLRVGKNTDHRTPPLQCTRVQ